MNGTKKWQGNKPLKFAEEFKKMRELWGDDSQVLMAIEELAELSQALCKYLRLKDNLQNLPPEEIDAKRQKNIANIKEEIADVLNYVKQLAVIFGYDEIYQIRESKVHRTMGKMQNSSN